MSSRFEAIPGFGIDRVAAAAGADPEVLRMENLDTDVRPCDAALEATRKGISEPEGNSYLPFTGRLDLREAIAARIAARGGPSLAADQVTITSGEGDSMVNALHAVVDPGDEVVVTDPTYAGVIQRVRLVGAVPRHVPLIGGPDGWRLDLAALGAAIGERTRAIFLMSPGMPSGHVLTEEEWAAVAALCWENGIWLIYASWWEGVLFGGREPVHPGGLQGLAERTIECGSFSFEQRMIGWRIGWTTGPPSIAPTLALAHIYNGIVSSGFGQMAALAALGVDDVDEARAEWERRHDTVVEQLSGLPLVPAHGGWAALLDAEACGLSAPDLSARLLEQKVAATPMSAWGETVAPRFVRFVYSREPVSRLETLGERVRAAIG